MSPTQTTTTSVPSVSEDMSSTSSAVTSTINTTNPTPPETHSCPYSDCNKSFSKKYNLKAHLRLHTGEEPFECDRPDCRKKFKWRSSLSSHSVWHTRKDNANASSPTTTTTSKSCSPSSKPSSPQKTSSSRPVRVAPHPTTQHVNINSTSVSGSVTSPTCRKKRPRSEMSGSSLDSTNSVEAEHSRLSSTSRIRSKPVRSAAKKRRARASATPNKGGSEPKQDVPTTGCTYGQEVEEDKFMAPGSPVTSDGSNCEQALDMDEFSCDILQPLLARGDALELGTDHEVGAIIGGEDGQLFGYEDSASCVPLSGFDSRFEQFDLDNFANFYLNKMEGF